ncbi:MAG: hypothetical protein JRH11_03650 [Deltaproteobacteria bacterium]|nr:hypothetical protein [Deltaproteobacteria bacterium]
MAALLGWVEDGVVHQIPSTRSLAPLLLGLSLLGSLSACSGAYGPGQGTHLASSGRPAPAPPRPVVRFPTEAELEAIVTRAPAPEVASLTGRPPAVVDSWQIEESPAPGDPVYDPEGPIEALLSRLASGEGIALRRSESLRCTAREMARFRLANDGPTTSRLARHLLSACGSAAHDVGTFALTYPARRSDQAVAQEMASRISGDLRRNLSHGSWIGVGFARSRGTALMVIAFAEPKVAVDPWAGPDGQGRVRFTGTLRTPGTRISAAITQGPHDAATCTVDSGLTAPAFALDCPMVAEDAEALVEVMLTNSNSLERRVLASLTVQRDASRALGFAPTGAAVDDAPVSAARVLSVVNAQRAAAGLEPLALAAAQSERHQFYASALFGLSAVDGGDALNDLVLGLMAGWRVEGAPIRDASSVWMHEQRDASLARVIGGLLETPSGRSALMSPDARQLAVGFVEGDAPKHLGVVVTSYEFFEGVDHRAEAAKVLDGLSALRRRRGLPPVEPLGTLPALTQAATSVAAQGTWPDIALRTGLDQDSMQMRAALQASHIEAVTLDEFPYPVQAVNAARLNASVVVTHTRAEGAAWGQYVVFLVMR